MSTLTSVRIGDRVTLNGQSYLITFLVRHHDGTVQITLDPHA
jgi:hypothetical protein